MKYVVSDIHGCYEEYREALERIRFSAEDTLFVLGDCVDRGPEPVRLLRDMMARPNVCPLIGNHELMALLLLRKLCVDITPDNADVQLTPDDLRDIQNWLKDGGQATLDDFRRLTGPERQELLDYLGEFSLYEETEAGGNRYLLVHGGLEPFDPSLAVEDYDIMQLLFSHANYDQVYFPDRYTVTGHTPTPSQPGNRGTILRKNNHIAIDCGCVFGYNLAVLCLDTGEEFYIPRRKGPAAR